MAWCLSSSCIAWSSNCITSSISDSVGSLAEGREGEGIDEGRGEGRRGGRGEGEGIDEGRGEGRRGGRGEGRE